MFDSDSEDNSPKNDNSSHNQNSNDEKEDSYSPKNQKYQVEERPIRSNHLQEDFDESAPNAENEEELNGEGDSDLEIEYTHVPEHLLEGLPKQSRDMILKKLLDIDTELARQQKVKKT